MNIQWQEWLDDRDAEVVTENFAVFQVFHGEIKDVPPQPEIAFVPYKLYHTTHGVNGFWPPDDSQKLQLWKVYPVVCSYTSAVIEGVEHEIHTGEFYVIVPRQYYGGELPEDGYEKAVDDMLGKELTINVSRSDVSRIVIVIDG